MSSRTKSPVWRGDVAASVDLTQKLGLDASYERRDRQLEGWSLVSSLYLGTLNFSGADPRDITQLVDAHTRLDRVDSLASVRLSARQLGPFTAWAEYTLDDQDLDLHADPSEIVVPGAQEGRFKRTVDGYAAGLALSVKTLNASLEWRDEDANRAVVRTDFDSRDRYRLRVGWKPVKLIQVVGTAEKVEASNPAGGIRYDADTHHYAVQLLVNPVKDLTLHVGYDGYSTDSSTLIRLPYDFETEPWLHSEDGKGVEAGLDWRIDRFTVDGGYSRYDNSGTFAFTLDHGWARLGVDLTNTIGAAVEYETYTYSEDLFAPANFDSARYGLFLRLRL